MDVFWNIQRLDQPISAKTNTEYYRAQNDRRKKYSYQLVVSVDRAIERYNLVTLDDNLQDYEKSMSIVSQIANSVNNIEIPAGPRPCDSLLCSYPFGSTMVGNLENITDLLDLKRKIALHAIWSIHYKCKIVPNLNYAIGDDLSNILGNENNYQNRRARRKLYKLCISWQKKWIFISSINNTPQVVKYFSTFKKGAKYATDFLRSNFNVNQDNLPCWEKDEFYVTDDANVRVGLYKDGELE